MILNPQNSKWVLQLRFSSAADCQAHSRRKGAQIYQRTVQSWRQGCLALFAKRDSLRTDHLDLQGSHRSSTSLEQPRIQGQQPRAAACKQFVSRHSEFRLYKLVYPAHFQQSLKLPVPFVCKYFQMEPSECICLFYFQTFFVRVWFKFDPSGKKSTILI